jgi:hypothetical protein
MCNYPTMGRRERPERRPYEKRRSSPHSPGAKPPGGHLQGFSGRHPLSHRVLPHPLRTSPVCRIGGNVNESPRRLHTGHCALYRVRSLLLRWHPANRRDEGTDRSMDEDLGYRIKGIRKGPFFLPFCKLCSKLA